MAKIASLRNYITYTQGLKVITEPNKPPRKPSGTHNQAVKNSVQCLMNFPQLKISGSERVPKTQMLLFPADVSPPFLRSLSQSAREYRACFAVLVH